MPYSVPDNIPDAIKNIPLGAQKRFVAAFNSALSAGATEDEARIAGWANVKRKYKKQGDKWVKKFLSAELNSKVDTIIPDDVLELPGNLSVAWVKLYNGLFSKHRDPMAARLKTWKAIKKYIYQEGGKWHFRKRLKPIEADLYRKAKEIPLIQVFKSDTSNSQARFRIDIPIAFTKSSVTEENGIKYLKGIASGTWLDRQNDVIHQDFIRKMNESCKNLPVFVDHKRDSDHMIGQVIRSEGGPNTFAPVTALEKEWSETNPTGNVQVAKLLDRLNKNYKLQYSIGGFLTKAVRVWDEKLQKNIRHIFDGDILEVSVVPIGALPGSDVALVTMNKKLFDEMFADFDPAHDEEGYASLIKSMGLESQIGQVYFEKDADLDEKSNDESNQFWADFQKAVDTFSGVTAKQIAASEIDLNKLPRSCFLVNTSVNKDAWKYPYKFVDEDGGIKVHMELLDKSFHQSQIDGDKLSFNKLLEIRKSLGIDEKSYEYVDFQKLLVATLAEAAEARKTRSTMYDILDQFTSSVYQIVWDDNPEYSVDEKSKDIKGLADQLATEIKTLAEMMSKEVIYTVKSLSL